LSSKWSKRRNFEIKFIIIKEKTEDNLWGFQVFVIKMPREEMQMEQKRKLFSQHKFVCLKQFNKPKAQISILVSKTQLRFTKQIIKKNQRIRKTEQNPYLSALRAEEKT